MQEIEVNDNILSQLREQGSYIFLSGIGGIGISAIAEILIKLEVKVAGSDLASNANITRLEKLGAKIFIGQQGENIKGMSLFARSTAIKDDNPEVIAAKNLGIPILSRAEIMRLIMLQKKSISVTGSHGKTTTTSIIAHLLDRLMPGTSLINGGIVNSYKTNAYYGEGDWIVAEADESDGSFLKLPADIAVITNLDPEHLDYYGSFANLKQSFQNYVDRDDADHLTIYCIDNQNLSEVIHNCKNSNLVSYGFSSQADNVISNVRFYQSGCIFDLNYKKDGKEFVMQDIKLPMFGKHNILNSLPAIIIALNFAFTDSEIKDSLADFAGVKRRLTVAGKVNNITIIDDYAHHPEEIKASLKAVKEMIDFQQNKAKLIAVLQPHRYSRVESLFAEFSSCFTDADLVFLTDIYAAGETEIAGINKNSLAASISEKSAKEVIKIADFADLPILLKQYIEPDDIVICLGAGNISKFANLLPRQLEELFSLKNAG